MLCSSAFYPIMRYLCLAPDSRIEQSPIDIDEGDFEWVTDTNKTIDPSSMKRIISEEDAWSALSSISSEIEYRLGISQQPSTFTGIRIQILPILKDILKYETFTPYELDRELDTRKLLIHLYAEPVQQGMVAKDPKSKFLKRNAIKIYCGTTLSFQSFVKDVLKISVDEHVARLRDSGFEESME